MNSVYFSATHGVFKMAVSKECAAIYLLMILIKGQCSLWEVAQFHGLPPFMAT